MKKQILYLNVKGEYFDQVRSGEKKEEYRLVNNFWRKRLDMKTFDEIHYLKGYPKKSDMSRRLVFPWNGYNVREITHKEFGKEPVSVYAIKLKKLGGSMDIHFSSNTDLWETPQEFFDMLNNEFGFTLDVCATKENAKCQKFFTIEDDGLNRAWSGVCWMNPPYGRQISRWMEKAYTVSKYGTTVVCLVPSSTDTKWWHDYAMKGEIRFVIGKLKFGNTKHSAPFPSAVIIFKKNDDAS